MLYIENKVYEKLNIFFIFPSANKSYPSQSSSVINYFDKLKKRTLFVEWLGVFQIFD